MMVGTRLNTGQQWLWSHNITLCVVCPRNVVSRLWEAIVPSAVVAMCGVAPSKEGCGETGEHSLETMDLAWAWGQGKIMEAGLGWPCQEEAEEVTS